MSHAMKLRQRFCEAGCSFSAKIKADYGDIQHEFQLQCEVDDQGNCSFTVQKPETIAGVTGRIEESAGKLTFDDQAVAFSLMADGQLSPVSAPWLMVKTLRGGYLSSCCREDDLLHISIDDSYEAETLRLEIWFDDDSITFCEIYWQGRMLLSVNVEEFTYV